MNKSLIYVSLIISFLFFIMIQTKLIHKSNHIDVVRQSLYSAMEETMDDVMGENVYTIQTTEEFLNVYGMYLSRNLKGNMDLELKILNIDIEKGSFSLQAKGTYKENDIERTEKNVVVTRTYFFEKQDKSA